MNLSLDSIREVQKMLDTNVFDSNLLLQILNSFGEDIAVIPIMLLAEQKVLRTRPNKDDFFGYIHELSYPPAEFARTDRASLEGKPMFYASVFTKDTEKTKSLPRIVSALETIPLLKDIGASGVKVMTQSVWMVNEPIHAFAFPFSDKYKRACSEIDMLNKGWNKTLIMNYSNESIEFFTYIGDLMALPQTSCLYDITATCVDYILSNFNFEGVIYPSVPVEGEGMNICIKPAVVDSKISFSGAAIEVILRSGMQSRIEVLGHANIISDDAFEWIITNDGKILMSQAGMIRPEQTDREIVVRSQELMNKLEKSIYEQ